VIFALTFFASFVFIFLRAFQQRNVAFDHEWIVLPTALVMAFAEVYVVANIAVKGYSIPLVLTVGAGSGFGTLAAMWSHKKVFRRR